jgi:hypothetical protein
MAFFTVNAMKQGIRCFRMVAGSGNQRVVIACVEATTCALMGDSVVGMKRIWTNSGQDFLEANGTFRGAKAVSRQK